MKQNKELIGRDPLRMGCLVSILSVVVRIIILTHTVMIMDITNRAFTGPFQLETYPPSRYAASLSGYSSQVEGCIVWAIATF